MVVRRFGDSDSTGESEDGGDSKGAYGYFNTIELYSGPNQDESLKLFSLCRGISVVVERQDGHFLITWDLYTYFFGNWY